MTKTYRVFIDVRASNKEHALKGAKALAAQEGFDSFRIQEAPFTDEEEGTIIQLAADSLKLESSTWLFNRFALTRKQLNSLLKKITAITNRP
jgi:hypothetical protein